MSEHEWGAMSRPHLISLLGETDALRADAEQLDAVLCHADNRSDGGALPQCALLVGEGSETALATGLAQPYRGFLELDSQGGLAGVGPRCLRVARQGGLVASLTTATAFSCDLVGRFAKVLRERMPNMSAGTGDDLEMCLAEAVGNAVVHGNLEIGSGLRTNRDDFELYCNLLKEGLANPELSARRVEVCWMPLNQFQQMVVVSDQGQGFDFSKQLSTSCELEAKSGRGLPLIKMLARSVSAEDGGRSLVMTF